MSTLKIMGQHGEKGNLLYRLSYRRSGQGQTSGRGSNPRHEVALIYGTHEPFGNICRSNRRSKCRAEVARSTITK
ncbi:hypothetical protein [Dinghuibacter silviterrae]|uniref:hypothetical protein n=1 Tax=Dinghuibacter silviterrae TaxID=1539049 RepID=UPI0010636E7A|nr:hypothetical protein [Dinghuibacter silviterrae]